MADIQFDQVEPIDKNQGSIQACSVCKQSITDVYYTLNNQVICATCRVKIQRAAQPSARNGINAAARGLLAALAGAALYYGVRLLTGYQIGLIAVLVGYMVGKSVRRGSKGIGGRGYQALAVALTYFSIVLTYVPYFWRALVQVAQNGDMVRLLSLSGIALLAPFEVAIKNPLSLFITAIALWEAWKLTRPVALTFLGPFKVGAPR